MLRSYLFDATYEWLVDHDLTPYILIDTEIEGTMVPEEYTEPDGKIVLNLSPNSISDYQYSDECITFEASFDEKNYRISIPFEAILALYSEETDQGLFAKERDYGLFVEEGQSTTTLYPKKNQGAKQNATSNISIISGQSEPDPNPK